VQTVNMQENEEEQRKIIKNFAESVKSKRFLNKEDYDEVFSFFEKLTEAACQGYSITSECETKSNKLELLRQNAADSMPESEWVGMDIAGCDYSESYDKDIIFSLDPVFFCKKYFGKENIKDRFEGIAELLLTVYHEVDHAVRLMGVSRSYLSPEIFETSKEIFLRDLLGSEFYMTNYGFFSFERYADKHAYDVTSEMLKGTEASEIADNFIELKNLTRDDFSVARLGKISYGGKTYVKSKLLSELCDEEISKTPHFLYRYPILGKQYNSDGTCKDLYELFEEMTGDLTKIIKRYSFLDSGYKLSTVLQREYLDCITFYYELIMPRLTDATDREYKKLGEKYGVTFLQKVLSGMEKYFNDNAAEKLKCAEKCSGVEYESPEEIAEELKSNINSIVRFRNGAVFNPIAERLLREGGFVRGTREMMSEDLIKRRRMFADSLIGVYDATESEDEYKQRAENEKNDIDEAVNALYCNRFENFLKNVEIGEKDKTEFGKAEITRTVQILKIVKILSSETGRDYFGEFLKIPDVNRLMIIFEKDHNGYLRECMQNSRLRIKKVIYPATEAEEGKYRDYISGNRQDEAGLDIKSKTEMLNEEIEALKRGEV